MFQVTVPAPKSASIPIRTEKGIKEQTMPKRISFYIVPNDSLSTVTNFFNLIS